MITDLKKEEFWVCKCEGNINIHSNNTYFCIDCEAIEPEQSCPSDFDLFYYKPEIDQEKTLDYEDYLTDQGFLAENKAVSRWVNCCMGSVIQEYEQDHEPDRAARSESFNNYMDTLHQDGIIDDKLVQNICIPDDLETCSLNIAKMNY